MRRGIRPAALSLAILTATAVAAAQGELLAVPAQHVAPLSAGSLSTGPLGPSVVWEECGPNACPWQIGPQGEVILGDAFLGEVIPGGKAPPSSLPRGKPGPLQAVSLTADWLPRFGSDGLGSTDLSASLTLGLPFPTRKSPLLITPSFAAHFLDGPTAPERVSVMSSTVASIAAKMPSRPVVAALRSSTTPPKSRSSASRNLGSSSW